MNLIFGTASVVADATAFDSLSTSVADLHGSPRELGGAESSSLRMASLTDGGPVVGLAEDGPWSICLMGPLHLPLPGYSGGAPASHPNACARYLLDRWRLGGCEALQGIYGNYVFAIADRQRGELILGVSPNGLREIAYHIDGDKLSYCTNLYALVRAFRGRLQPDRSLEDFFLNYGFFPFGRTGFRDVRFLSPATVLRWCEGKHEIEKIEKVDPWADRLRVDFDRIGENEAAQALHDAFVTALAEQTCDEPNVAVLLGGFDSALVAAGLARAGKQVETFSYRYGDHRFDQPHTDTLARAIGSKHTWVDVDADVIRDGLARYPQVFSRPSNWVNYLIQTELVCRRARDAGYTHCYSGDGCDTVFLGYPRTHDMANLMKRAAKLPAFAWPLAMRAVDVTRLDRLLGRVARVGLNVVRDMTREHPARGLINFRVFDELSLRKLRSGERPVQEMEVDEVLAKLGAPLAHLSPDRLAYEGKALIGLNKTKIWSSSDSAGVTYASPYMHAGLARFARQIPDRLLRPEHETRSVVTGKYILMKMAEDTGLLPPEVIYQDKLAAVDAPVDEWYKGPLRAAFERHIMELPFPTNRRFVEHLFTKRRLESLYAERFSSDHITTHELSLLATYGSFYH